MELHVLLGRLSPPLRLEPRERHRGPHQDGADDAGCEGKTRPASFEFPGALLPTYELKTLNVLQQVDLQSDIVHASDHCLGRLPGDASRRFDEVVDLTQLF
ncbi:MULTISPECIES: hypothetical protein [unclassified Bradyrhizobium]|uniref:hypothetical protein n=1 Tax=unclassified Bradyrhizobium TaxID=2631580 RepID=UPI001FF89709|nr:MULTISPECIES: hypothetical protein [unclassified Bradyrhizobium]